MKKKSSDKQTIEKSEAAPRWSPRPLPDALDIPVNKQVAAYIRDQPLSDHSGIADLVRRAEAQLAPKQVKSHVSSAHEHSYELRYGANHVVFLVVGGQGGVSFRLPDSDIDAIRADGGLVDSAIGSPWFVFSNLPETALKTWYLRAQKRAKNTSLESLAASIDLNAAINAYSHSMGNQRATLDRYASTTAVTIDVDDIASEIRGIQNALYKTVMDNAGKMGFSPRDLEHLVVEAAVNPYPWLNTVGKQALLRWLVWMCWHEGYLRKDVVERERIDQAVLRLTSQDEPILESAGLDRALQWLLEVDDSEQAFVIVDTPDGAPFVQFAGSADSPLTMDIPVEGLTALQERELADFFEQVGLTLEPNLSSYVLWIGTDIRRAVNVVHRILGGLFGVHSGEWDIVRGDQGGNVSEHLSET